MGLRSECTHCQTELKGTSRWVKRHEKLCEKYHKYVLKEKDDKGFVYICDLCRSDYKSLRSIFQHLSRMHFQSFYSSHYEKCSNCNQRYDKSKSKHLELCTLYSDKIRFEDGKWFCDICDKNSKSQTSMFTHMTKTHGPFVSNTDESNPVSQVTNEIVLESYNPENSSSDEFDDSDEESNYDFLDEAAENIEIKTHLETNEDKSTNSGSSPASPVAKQRNVSTENGFIPSNKNVDMKSDGPVIQSVHGSIPKDILGYDKSSKESKIQHLSNKKQLISLERFFKFTIVICVTRLFLVKITSQGICKTIIDFSKMILS